MNNINLTTELCAEDRARIDKLAAALEGLTSALGAVGTPFQTVKSEEDAPPTPNILKGSTGVAIGKTPAEPLYEEGTGVDDLGFIPIETDEEDEPEAPQETAAPKHTKAELQQKVVGLVSKGKKEEVKEIIKQYAAKVSEVPEDKVDEVWAKLDKLEG
ncbi:MAG: hypothetical protein J6B99_09795 [Oscillospiraceae bacterium]|nr:hypothetical protein [Oscillospiraceae bacterium]